MVDSHQDVEPKKCPQLSFPIYQTFQDPSLITRVHAQGIKQSGLSVVCRHRRHRHENRQIWSSKDLFVL